MHSAQARRVPSGLSSLADCRQPDTSIQDAGRPAPATMVGGLQGSESSLELATIQAPATDMSDERGTPPPPSVSPSLPTGSPSAFPSSAASVVPAASSPPVTPTPKPTDTSPSPTASPAASAPSLQESRWKTAVVAAVDLPQIGPPQSTPTNGTIGRTDVTQLRSRGRPVQGHSSARFLCIDLVSTVVGRSFLRPRP